MRRGVRVVAKDVPGVTDQVNRFIEEFERDVSEENARAGGFTPFGFWQNVSLPVWITLEAGIPTDLSVAHGLKDRGVKRIVPNAYLVTTATGDYQLTATLATWNEEIATFEALSFAGARLKMIFWRDP